MESNLTLTHDLFSDGLGWFNHQPTNPKNGGDSKGLKVWSLREAEDGSMDGCLGFLVEYGGIL